MGYLHNYLNRMSYNGNQSLSRAINETTNEIIPKYVSSFTFRDHVVGLLMGNVQSGKTSHMFGLICAAADEGFGIFIMLTTDNIVLQQQTIDRAKSELCDFCICDENDYLKFASNNMKMPAVIVLKKNSRVLKQWKNNLSSTSFCLGNPLFIVDDEADAASINTMVNQNKRSTINRVLDEIKKTASSSIFMQVTGTPQAILLQSIKSGWKPYFIHYFEPGENYLGGDFFFRQDPPECIIFNDEDEAQDILIDDEFPENNLKVALKIHLLTSAYLMISGEQVSNFLIHPSVKTNHHSTFAERIGDYLNEISITSEENETILSFEDAYINLKSTKPNLPPFDLLYKWIKKTLEDDNISILVINSITSYEENVCYSNGVNIIIGGNSLGRGITFPKLQTIYYCRQTKRPQADTMWQHARMFGYDREPEMMRVFLPSILYKLFTDINATNNNIIAQIQKYSLTDIKICYPKELKPTRKSVIDRNEVEIYSGGVNYFPFYPSSRNIEDLDEMLRVFDDDIYTVSLKFIVSLLEKVESETDDWSGDVFAGFIKSLIAENPLKQGKLIVRRNRDIGRGTGTLLSPNDRKIGDSIKDEVVLTLYKITGNKGWDGQQLWIPNIKLPGDIVYYCI